MSFRAYGLSARDAEVVRITVLHASFLLEQQGYLVAHDTYKMLVFLVASELQRRATDWERAWPKYTKSSADPSHRD